MTIDEILGLPVEEAIKELKKKQVEVPAWSELEKQYCPDKHDIITDKSLRPDDKIGVNGKVEKTAKLTYAAEQIAVRRMVQMAFSIPVKRIYDTGGDEVKKAQAKALEAVYQSVRIDGVNMNRMRAYFACCETMTIWYTIESPNTLYGFESGKKLKCRSYSPMPAKLSKITQADLYPYFDEYDDLIAMSFEYVRTEGENQVTYFDTYTSDTHIRWKKGGGDWEEAIPAEPIPIGKHPLVYLCRPGAIYDGVQNNRSDIEFTLSRGSDIIRKNVSPIIKIIGDLIGEKPAGDTAREVYQLKNGGDLGVVSPAFSLEAAKVHTDTLRQLIEEDLQLPNLSMENLKGLGPISGEARKTLLTDAHLKVGDEKHDILWALDRECNVIKAFLGQMNVAWKDTINDLKVKHVITPFVQNDELSDITKYEKATGGKPIMSQYEAVRQLGMVENIDKEIERLDQEASATRPDMFEEGV